MAQDPIEQLRIPIEARDQLRQAVRLIQSHRADPASLLCWRPEACLPVLERQRRELALSIQLVLALDVGSGDLESRFKACRTLYVRGMGAPAEAVKAGELLFRSRLMTGATDVETFWLAATFAQALYPIASEDLRETAWRYLCHAPFALDPRTALNFARASLEKHHAPFQRWPLELVDALLRRAEHADLGATLLEAHLCASLGEPNMGDAAEKLRAIEEDLPKALFAPLELLASYYTKTEADAPHARTVVSVIAHHSVEVGDYEAYLKRQLFDLPYDTLYQVVRAHIRNTGHLDSLYEAYVDGDRLDVARRLIECELVRRLDPWYVGGIQPHIKLAIQRVLAGADLRDPRVRELAGRLALLVSKSRVVSDDARALVRRAAVLSEYTGHGSPLRAWKEELEHFLANVTPETLIRRERALVEQHWEELDASERKVIKGVYSWMRRRHQPQVESLKAVSSALDAPESDVIASFDRRDSPERALERLFRKLYRSYFGERSQNRLKRKLEASFGLPFDELPEADVARIVATARRFARRDITLATLGGVAGGLVGGPLGVTIDLVTLALVSAHGATRIGACFGIMPGSPRGFEFFVDALTMSFSAEAGDGLVAYLVDRRSRIARMAAQAGALYLVSRLRRHLLSPRPGDHGGMMVKALTLAWKRMGRRKLPLHLVELFPIFAAITQGAAHHWFLREITEASLNLAARRWVLSRHGLLARRGEEQVS